MQFQPQPVHMKFLMHNPNLSVHIRCLWDSYLIIIVILEIKLIALLIATWMLVCSYEYSDIGPIKSFFHGHYDCSPCYILKLIILLMHSLCESSLYEVSDANTKSFPSTNFVTSHDNCHQCCVIKHVTLLIGISTWAETDEKAHQTATSQSRLKSLNSPEWRGAVSFTIKHQRIRQLNPRFLI